MKKHIVHGNSKTRFISRRVWIGAILGALSISSISNSAQAEQRDEPVCVITPTAKLRSGPSTSSKVTWKVGKHMPLQRIAVENGWSQVRDLRGQTHWVISKNVSVNESCAVVRVRTAALHTGPGTNQPRADFKGADRYTPFKKVDREGAWVRLEDEYRGSYWTRDSNVWIPVKRSRMSF